MMERLLVAIVALSVPSLAEPCGCPRDVRAPSEARDQVDAVFIGTVEKMEPVKGDPLDEWKVTLRVQHRIKGELAKNAVMMTSQREVNCGYRFIVGRQFLVYARNSMNVLRVDSCLRTRPVGWAAEDLKAFGIDKPTRQE